MTAISKSLIILSTLIAVALSRRCEVSVPFTTRLVGKSFSKFDDCYRPSTQSNIRVFAKRFAYRPFIIRTFQASACEERFVFHIRRGEEDPFVVRFPELVYNGGLTESITSEELERFCDREQPKIREKYFPVGETRKMFRRAVRTIVKGVEEIRDFGCIETDDGIITRNPERAFNNVDLDGIVTYLFGVAYQYNFCAEH